MVQQGARAEQQAPPGLGHWQAESSPTRLQPLMPGVRESRGEGPPTLGALPGHDAAHCREWRLEAEGRGMPDSCRAEGGASQAQGRPLVGSERQHGATHSRQPSHSAQAGKVLRRPRSRSVPSDTKFGKGLPVAMRLSRCARVLDDRCGDRQDRKLDHMFGLFTCTFPGCNAQLSPSMLAAHAKSHLRSAPRTKYKAAPVATRARTGGAQTPQRHRSMSTSQLPTPTPPVTGAAKSDWEVSKSVQLETASLPLALPETSDFNFNSSFRYEDTFLEETSASSDYDMLRDLVAFEAGAIVESNTLHSYFSGVSPA